MSLIELIVFSECLIYDQQLSTCLGVTTQAEKALHCLVHISRCLLFLNGYFESIWFWNNCGKVDKNSGHMQTLYGYACRQIGQANAVWSHWNHFKDILLLTSAEQVKLTGDRDGCLSAANGFLYTSVSNYMFAGEIAINERRPEQ